MHCFSSDCLTETSKALWWSGTLGRKGLSQGFRLLSANLTGAGEPERLDGARASASLFSILGVSPLLGRTFTLSEDRPGANRLVVLGFRFWLQRFAGQPGIIGREITLDDARYTVIGVMPSEFRFSRSVNLSKLNSPRVDFWMPLAMTPAEQESWSSVGVYTVARLKPGVMLAQARSETESLIRDNFKANELDLGMLAAVLFSVNCWSRRSCWPRAVARSAISVLSGSPAYSFF
jgi:hypothetical protein